MKNATKLIALSLGLVLLSSCKAKKPYTTSVQEKYQLGDQEIKSLQFYLQGDITLMNGQRDGSTGTEDGKLVIKDEQNSNKLIIPNGTNGVVEIIEDDALYVSFEHGKNLRFKASQVDGKYRLKADNWDSQKNRGEVTYGSEKYFVTSGSKRAYLVFILDKKTKQRSNSKVVKGRKL